MIDLGYVKTSLKNSDFISSVIYSDEMDSTNDHAKNKDIPVDSLILTDYQSAGKGRAGRKWFSEKHSGLTFSLKKELTISPAENHLAVFYFSYNLFTVLRKLLSEDLPEKELSGLTIKWPNDILFGNKKISGLLIESFIPSGIYIIGIGINCNQNTFNEDINAVSLKQITGKDYNISTLLIGIISEFSKNFDILKKKNIDKLFKNWKESSGILNKKCSFINDSGIIKHGIIRDLNQDGSISINFNGKTDKFFSGEIKITGID